MKKTKKKSDRDTGKFSSRPFASLGAIKVETSASEVGRPAKELGSDSRQRSVEEDDLSLFIREMADVRRLQPGGKSPVRKKGEGKDAIAHTRDGKEIRERLEAEEIRLFTEAIRNLRLDVTFRDHFPDGGEEREPRPVNRLRQLKNGQMRIALELDLHGLTREEALQSLETFISGAHRRGQKAVLVITGKGNNSPGEPVLHGAVMSWLRERGRGMVAEFAPAPRELGGSGAIVVFLRTSGKKAG